VKKWIAFVLAVVVLAGIHESTHALFAVIYNDYETLHIRPLGAEVTYKTPVNERSGFQWALISGASNLVTVLMGYLLFILGKRFVRSHNMFVKTAIYYLTILSLLFDPFNLSIGPFIYGGDINGIVIGLGINRYVIQVVFFLILLVNREIIARKLLPMYGVQTRHPLFRPLL